MRLRRAGALLAVSALVDVLGARVLDSLGLIEGLLSPSGARLLLIAPLAALFYAARFCALFVAPGLLLGAQLLSLGRCRLTSGD